MVATIFKKTQRRCNTPKRGAGPGQDTQGQKQGCWCLVSGRTAPEMGLFHQEQAAAQGQQKS